MDRGDLGAAAAEADLGRPLDEVDRRQVVPLHHPHELADGADVVGLGRVRRVLRHSCTPRSSFVALRRSRRSGWGPAVLNRPGPIRRAGDVGQDLAAVGGYQHVVFDPDATPAGQVDAWLDGNDHAGLKRDVGFLAEPRGLMDIEAQAVTQAVGKKRAETGLLDDGAGFGVDVPRHRTGPDRGDSSLLRRQDGPVDLLELGSDLTGDQHPRQVTFVGPAGRPPVDLTTRSRRREPRSARRPGMQQRREGRPPRSAKLAVVALAARR